MVNTTYQEYSTYAYYDDRGVGPYGMGDPTNFWSAAFHFTVGYFGDYLWMIPAGMLFYPVADFIINRNDRR